MSFLCCYYSGDESSELSFIVHNENEEEENEETNSDIFPIYSREDLKNELNESVQKGVLNHKIIATGLSVLKTNLDSSKWFLTKLVLCNMNLHDVNILYQYKEIRWLDLSTNHIHDMQFLQHTPELEYLSLERNNIDTLLVIRKGLFHMKVLNLAFNHIHHIPSNFSSQFQLLTHLNLSHNSIKYIKGFTFDHLIYLRVLDLSFNKLKKLENLSALNITELYVQNNKISQYVTGNEGIASNKNLVIVDISHNRLSTLELFNAAYSLVKLNAAGNKIQSPAEISHLAFLSKLRELNLENNPLTSWKFYKSHVMCVLKWLVKLDNEDSYPYKSSEHIIKVNTDYFLDQEFQQCCYKNPISLSYRKLPFLLACDKSNIFIILVGTLGCQLENICIQMSNRCSNVQVLRKFTTNPVQKKNLINVTNERIQDLLSSEEFIAVVEYNNAKYGYSIQDIYNCLSKGKVCLTDMDLPTALSMRFLGYDPYIILVTVENEELHKEFLLKMFEFNLFQNKISTKIEVKPQISTETRMNAPCQKNSSSSFKFTKVTNHKVEEDFSMYSWYEFYNRVMQDFKNKVIHCQTEESKEFHPHANEIDIRKKNEFDFIDMNSTSNKKGLLMDQTLLNSTKETFVKDVLQKSTFYEEFYNKHRELIYSKVSIDDTSDIIEKLKLLLFDIVESQKEKKKIK